jgi:hypothetical protein
MTAYKVPGLLGEIEVCHRPKKKLRKKMGVYSMTKRRITLREGMHTDAEAVTLWHEWIHSVLTDAGVQLEESQAESVADSIAGGLHRAGLVLPRL